MKKTMIDYLGNKIKHGMIIKIIRTTPSFLNDGNWYCVGEWDVVKCGDGKIRYGLPYSENDLNFLFLLEGIEWGFSDGDLLTIKGISDEQPS